MDNKHDDLEKKKHRSSRFGRYLLDIHESAVALPQHKREAANNLIFSEEVREMRDK
jgi:hypothetical protein